MRLFYIKFPIFQTLSGKLAWSHYAELLGISDDTSREFYIKQCEKENWSIRELKRQISTSLFERIALSKDKKGVLQLAKQGLIISGPNDIVKDPYVLEFLKISEEIRMTESNLEQKIIDNLQVFLLELGKGFSFVGRQYRITLDNEHYYVDLVFYHRILKCFVLIDLKTRHVKHYDIGQMNLYLNYFKTEENTEGDNPPIGIVLGADKNDILVEYAIGGISNNIFVSKYQLYLPDKKQLEEKVKELINE
jgi:predicted nuclease of restriction endonuclease-like (RecB) superfamily